MASSGVTLGDLLTSLSLATDLGFGQPMEHMLRASRIAMRLGGRLGLTDGELATLYDVSLLTYVGCPVYGNEAARIFGDDIEFRAAVQAIDLAGIPATMFMLRRAGRGTTARNRARQVAGLMATNGRQLVAQMANHCAAAGQLAEGLQLGDEVKVGIEQAYARWDGRGEPAGLGGEDVSLAARVAHLAEACEVLERTIGVDGCIEVIQARRGTQFDPTIVDALVADPRPLVEGIGDHTVEAVLDSEPIERPPLSNDGLDRALEAIGDFCDLRCSYFAGHARGTATLARAAARGLGLPSNEVRLLYRAALVHDVGRFGVPADVWDRPGPLSAADEERMRLHVYYAERMFSRPAPLRRVGLLAGSHHERCDGSGYHRGASGAMLALPARILAAADACHAMGQERPYRPARSKVEIRRELLADVDAGHLDGVAVDAVLEATGERPGRSRASGPSGLTARETDVVALLARGFPNKAIARELGISPKTVSNHLEHAYTKLGVSTRAAATMKALQHGIVIADGP